MIRTFTPNDVTRLIYNEMNDAEAAALKEQLLYDTELMEYYKEMKDLSQDLDNSMTGASQRTLNNILNYSKTVNLHPVK